MAARKIKKESARNANSRKSNTKAASVPTAKNTSDTAIATGSSTAATTNPILSDLGAALKNIGDARSNPFDRSDGASTGARTAVSATAITTITTTGPTADVKPVSTTALLTSKLFSTDENLTENNRPTVTGAGGFAPGPVLPQPPLSTVFTGLSGSLTAAAATAPNGHPAAPTRVQAKRLPTTTSAVAPGRNQASDGSIATQERNVSMATNKTSSFSLSAPAVSTVASAVGPLTPATKAVPQNTLPALFSAAQPSSSISQKQAILASSSSGGAVAAPSIFQQASAPHPRPTAPPNGNQGSILGTPMQASTSGPMSIQASLQAAQAAYASQAAQAAQAAHAAYTAQAAYAAQAAQAAKAAQAAHAIAYPRAHPGSIAGVGLTGHPHVPAYGQPGPLLGANGPAGPMMPSLGLSLGTQMMPQTPAQLKPPMNSQVPLQMHPQMNAQMHPQMQQQMISQANAQANSQLHAQRTQQMNQQRNAQMGGQMTPQMTAEATARLNSQINTTTPSSSTLGSSTSTAGQKGPNNRISTPALLEPARPTHATGPVVGQYDGRAQAMPAHNQDTGIMPLHAHRSDVYLPVPTNSQLSKMHEQRRNTTASRVVSISNISARLIKNLANRPSSDSKTGQAPGMARPRASMARSPPLSPPSSSSSQPRAGRMYWPVINPTGNPSDSTRFFDGSSVPDSLEFIWSHRRRLPACFCTSTEESVRSGSDIGASSASTGPDRKFPSSVRDWVPQLVRELEQVPQVAITESDGAIELVGEVWSAAIDQNRHAYPSDEIASVGPTTKIHPGHVGPGLANTATSHPEPVGTPIDRSDSMFETLDEAAESMLPIQSLLDPNLWAKLEFVQRLCLVVGVPHRLWGQFAAVCFASEPEPQPAPPLPSFALKPQRTSTTNGANSNGGKTIKPEGPIEWAAQNCSWIQMLANIYVAIGRKQHYQITAGLLDKLDHHLTPGDCAEIVVLKLRFCVLAVPPMYAVPEMLFLRAVGQLERLVPKLAADMDQLTRYHQERIAEAETYEHVRALFYDWFDRLVDKTREKRYKHLKRSLASVALAPAIYQMRAL